LFLAAKNQKYNLVACPVTDEYNLLGVNFWGANSETGLSGRFFVCPQLSWEFCYRDILCSQGTFKDATLARNTIQAKKELIVYKQLRIRKIGAYYPHILAKVENPRTRIVANASRSANLR
jgi:hypothetical protein